MQSATSRRSGGLAAGLTLTREAFRRGPNPQALPTAAVVDALFDHIDASGAGAFGAAEWLAAFHAEATRDEREAVRGSHADRAFELGCVPIAKVGGPSSQMRAAKTRPTVGFFAPGGREQSRAPESPVSLVGALWRYIGRLRN